MVEAQWTLARHDSSPSSARKAVREFLGDRVPSQDLDAVVLVVSELVTNAVRHTNEDGETLELSIDATRDVVHIEIEDHDAHPPVSTTPSDTSERGRGLAIVSALTSRWGWFPVEGNGKRIWFDLDCHDQGQ